MLPVAYKLVLPTFWGQQMKNYNYMHAKSNNNREGELQWPINLEFNRTFFGRLTTTTTATTTTATIATKMAMSLALL